MHETIISWRNNNNWKIFYISKSPKINENSKFLKDKEEVLTTAEVNMVLINKDNFSLIRRRPEFLSTAFRKLNAYN